MHLLDMCLKTGQVGPGWSAIVLSKFLILLYQLQLHILFFNQILPASLPPALLSQFSGLCPLALSSEHTLPNSHTDSYTLSSWQPMYLANHY